MNLRPLLIALCIIAAALSAGCGKDAEEEGGETVRYRERATAGIAGEIGVPDGVDHLGIIVFAEGTSYMALTDGEGAYHISNLTPGAYRLRAMRQDLEPAFVDEVTITDADLSKAQPFYRAARIELLERQAPGRNDRTTTQTLYSEVQGTVRTPMPGDEADVIVALEGTPWRTATLSGGGYQFMNVPEGEYIAVYTRRGYESARRAITVQPPDLTIVPMVELQMAADGGTTTAAGGAASVFGQIELLTGDGSVPNDFSGVRIAIEGTSFSATPDAQGRYRIANVTPGRYVISAAAPGYILEQKVNVDLAAVPQAEVNLLLVEDTMTGSEAGSIVGRVILQDSPTGSAGVMIAVSGTNLSAFSSTAGDYSILNVPVGTYEVIASFSGYRSVTLPGVAVAADEPTVLSDITLERDVEAPVVVFTSPVNGATGVPIEEPTRVTIQFSMPMDPRSVTSAISIVPAVGYRVVPQGTGNAERFLIELDAVPRGRGVPLRYGRQYAVTIANTARNDKGTPMKDPFRFAFTTGYATIIATEPATGGSDVIFALDRPIRVYFNAPVRTESINPDQIRFSPELVGRPNIHFETDQRTGWSILSIQGNGASDTEYRVEIGRGAQTVTGDSIRNLPYRFTFRTSRPRTFDEVYNTQPPGYDVREREEQRQ